MHCTSTPPANVPTKYQIPITYGFQDIAKDKMLKVTAARSNQGHSITMYNYIPQLMSLPIINLLKLMVSELKNGQEILKFWVTTARAKVKIKIYNDALHLHHRTNILTKYQIPIPHSF